MEQAVLTPAQKIVVDAVASEPKLADFYLSGGTALAGYYLNHRASDDLDFFTRGAFDTIFLHSFVEKLRESLSANAVRFEKLYDRNQFFFALKEGELKVEFTLYPFNQLEEPKVRDGLRVDSLRDIAVNKFMALIDRFDPKDFVDMFFLLQKCGLDTIRVDAKKKFGVQVSALSLGQEFTKVQRIVALPKMTKPLSIKELKSFFEKQATVLSPQFLDS